MKYSWLLILVITLLALISGCIKQFIPGVSEDQNMLVVEGLITDQPGHNTIKLTTSMPLGLPSLTKPLPGCSVTVSDNLGNVFSLNETDAGIYNPDPSFHGVVGRSYTLHIKTDLNYSNRSYQSLPVLMKPVPSIDSIYYDKLVLTRSTLDDHPTGEGCQIYLDTHDPENNCKYYRWEYTETWEIQLPYILPNNICWVSSNSDHINIKNTTSLTEDRIDRLPINFVANLTDRLKIRYSILVNQYSINQEEFSYWDKLQKTVEQVGSLYDITPASIPSNISCIEKPSEAVLGYFSVSAVNSKRIFINDQFRGMPNPYSDCENATIGIDWVSPGLALGVNAWVIIVHLEPPPPFRVVTFFKGCADCTVRGTNIKPDFW
jgi:hypothetical protein